MDEGEFTEEMSRAILLCDLLLELPVDELAAVISQAHAVMPIVDPTAYRAGLENLSDQQTILKAIRRAQQTLKEDPRVMMIRSRARAARAARTIELQAAMEAKPVVEAKPHG